MNLTVKQIYPQIIHMKYDDNYFLASAFMRIQEFYESPFYHIKGKKFNLFDYMDTYARAYGKFDYFTKWGGFNFPSHIMKKFFETQKVIYMKEAINGIYIHSVVNDWEKPFYVIGTTHNTQTIDHELAHAFYYLSKDYKKKMNDLIIKLPKSHINKLCNSLMLMGYCREVLVDEIQAYLSTSEHFKFIPSKTTKKFIDVLQSEKLKYL